MKPSVNGGATPAGRPALAEAPGGRRTGGPRRHDDADAAAAPAGTPARARRPDAIAPRAAGGISSAVIRRAENGAAVFPDTMRALARALGVAVEDLLAESQP